MAVSDALHSDDGSLTQREFLNHVQNIVQQAASLSRYFWPAYSKSPENHEIHQDRGRFLRERLGVSEESPLRNRELRNLIEHFDEYLDLYLSKPIAGNIVPEYVGLEPEDRNVPVHFFRAYFPETAVFEVLGKQYQVQPLTLELARLHQAIDALDETGSVFRP